MIFRSLFIMLFTAIAAFTQTPPIEPGVSHDLARWRAAHYSDVRYKLNLTLEKMSPVLKGTIEIRVKVSEPGAVATGFPIVLDWRKIRGSESLSTISNVTINGSPVVLSTNFSWPTVTQKPAKAGTQNEYYEADEHLIFRDGVVAGENVIKMDFTSPILTSGSAITRYVDREDGAEYIYSLFVPSDASTAFPVFDQPDLKARFTINVSTPDDWQVISNTSHAKQPIGAPPEFLRTPSGRRAFDFAETQPISTYVLAFTAGPWGQFSDLETISSRKGGQELPSDSHIYVRNSQYIRFGAHAAEVFRLEREGIKYLETYFDYKFPFPKYDIVLIPEFPFGGMEHAGATFLREASVIFPTEPTANDKISRANLIFHETAHQWFGDTVTMKWFDDLWLKEGFAEFMAYKTLEKAMPEANAWKVFYERNKQAAYLTDSTKGTTPIYQEIANLSAAKSAYGNIVYRKAPSFLRQAEFYLGDDKFQTAVRVFLKKHEFANAGWEDLVKELETASGKDLKQWAKQWVTQPGMPIFRGAIYNDAVEVGNEKNKRIHGIVFRPMDNLSKGNSWSMDVKFLSKNQNSSVSEELVDFDAEDAKTEPNYGNGISFKNNKDPLFVFPNYQDYGYGIFLLDDKSRDYVLKNIQNEKDPFLRSMMWGSLWDSVREAELAPKDYVELVVRVLSPDFSRPNVAKKPAKAGTQNAGTQNDGETDEGTIQSLLARVSTAMNYYLNDAQRAELAPKVEDVLIDKIQNAPTLGQRITFYRAFLNIASTERARNVLKQILKNGSKGGNPSSSKGAPNAVAAQAKDTHPTARVSVSDGTMPLRTKDKFDIVTRLIILGDPEAPALLAELEKTETSDDAKRYAYAAKAGIATAGNKAKFWTDFINNKDISESWIEAAFGPFNSVRHSELTQPYLEKALAELPNLKRNRKIFFVNGWLAAFIGGQRSEAALAIVNRFLADNPTLDKDLRLKILENLDLIERAVKIRAKFGTR